MAYIALEGLTALREQSVLIAAATGVAALLFGLDRLVARRRPGRARVGYAIFVLGTLALGLFFAYGTAWLCDDAFISFRYSENLAQGHGLVFNPGEWVEGYTNFLWTSALGGLAWLGADIPTAALVGDLLAYVMAVVAVAIAVRRASPGTPVVPFAAIALALARPFYTYATSGLETMPGAALVALALLVSTMRRGHGFAGILLTLAALTRPDHVLLVGAMGMAYVVEDLAHDRRLDLRRYAEYSAPFILVFLPYFAIRVHVYGDLFPNTYYAKSGGEAYYSQGINYLGEFVMASGGWAFLVAFVLAIFGRSRCRLDTRFRVFAVVSCVLLGGYIVRVGGDFMEHRFFVPLLPGIALATEVAVRNRIRRPIGRVALLVFSAIGLGAAVVPVHLIGPGEKRWHIAEEATFYRLKSVFPPVVDSGFRDRGLALHETFAARGHRPRIGEFCVGMLAYYSDLPVFDAYGLTSPRVAHRTIRARGTPGHEKVATLEDFLAEDVDLTFYPLWPEREDFLRVPIGDLNMFLARWTPELEEAFRDAGLRSPNIRRYVTQLSNPPTRQAALQDVAFLEVFLADHPNRDRLIFTQRQRVASIAELDCALPEGSRLSGGFAFQHGSVPPAGASGRCWLESDRADTGHAEIALGRITSPTLRFVVGGTSSTRLRVELRVEGRVVRSISPSFGHVLEPVVWDVTQENGRDASLVVVDDDPAGAILLDGVHAGDDPARALAEAARLPPAQLAPRLRWLVSELGEERVADLMRARGVRRYGFDRADLPSEVRVSGDAFTGGPVAHAVRTQQAVAGFMGERFVNSYQGFDEATGTLEIPLPGFDAGAISFLVGGGADCQRVSVTIRAADRILGRVCGTNSELLRPVTIRVPRRRSRAAVSVLIEDRSTGPWGHILVDDIIAVPEMERRPLATAVGFTVSEGSR